MYIRVITPIFATLVVGAAVSEGCNGSSACDRACRRVAECLGIDLDAGGAAGAWRCPLEGECTEDRSCVARCYEDAPCAALLGSDAAGVAQLAACQASCSQAPSRDGAPPAGDFGVARDRSLPPAPDALCSGGGCDQQVGACATEGCPAGSYCDLGSGRCLPGCASAAQCGGDACNLTTHACCDRGEVVCGGACVDTDSDPAHCGGCDSPCPPDEPLCSGGACGTGCPASPENTYTTCSDGCSNDGDPYIDCDDYDCCAVRSDCPQGTSCAPPPPGCDLGPEDTPARCADGCSNDGDKYIDCDDYDCCAIRSDCPAGTACGDS